MRRSLLVGVAAAVVLLAALPVGALLYVNHRIVPRGLEALERRIAETGGARLSIGDARFRPGNGLRLRELELTAGPGKVQLSAGELHIAASAAELRRLPAAARSLQPAAAHARRALARGLWSEALWSLLGALAAEGLPPASVSARQVTLRMSAGARLSPVEIELSGVTLRHRKDRGVIELTAGSGAGVDLSGGLELRYAARRATGELIVLGAAVPQLRHPAATLRGATLTLHLRGSLHGSHLEQIEGLVDLEDLSIDAPVLAPERIGPVDLRYSFAGTTDPSLRDPLARPGVPYTVRRALPRGELSLPEGRLEVNGLRLAAAAALRGLGPAVPHPVSGAPTTLPRRLSLDLSLAPTPLPRIAGAVPPQMRGPLSVLELDGSFAWDLALDVPRYNPGRASWEASGRLRGFAVRRIAAEVNPFILNGPFIHTIRDPAVGYLRSVRIPAAAAEHRPLVPAQPPPGTPTAADAATGAREARGPADPGYTYVRLWEMSEWVPKAVLTAEDGDFYYHGGVNFRTLAQAAARNVRAGEVVLGASTISMQLAKLLFLDDERIFSRKLQEVFLVYLMEHEVPVAKDRILEIYLNIAEFGPGVFGIHDAARYYFDTDPADLTAGEAMFLATVLPSPKRYHWYYARGEITDGWFIRMRSYFDIMLERERMTEDEYEEAIAEKPVFAK